MPSKTSESLLYEEGKTLDESSLWSWIRHYYSQGGVAVWSDGDIPFHITNTPVLAQEWCDSVLAMVRDFRSQSLIDPTQPIEIFELGAGTGRHGFFLWRALKHLQHLTQAFYAGGLRFRLHLAELGESGLASLARTSQS